MRPAILDGNIMQRIKGAKAWVPIVVALAGACSGTAVTSSGIDPGGPARPSTGTAGDTATTPPTQVIGTPTGTGGAPGDDIGIAGARPGSPPASVGGATSVVPGSAVGGYSSVGIKYTDGGNAGADGSDCPIVVPNAGERCYSFSECAYRALHTPCPTVVALCGVRGVWELSAPQCTNATDAPLTCPAQVPKNGWPCNLPTNVKSYDCNYFENCAPMTARCSGPGVWSVTVSGVECGGASASG